MSIMIKLFLLLYLLAAVLLTILGVVWVLTAMIKIESASVKMLLLKFHNNKNA
jgi:hypothetical protein